MTDTPPGRGRGAGAAKVASAVLAVAVVTKLVFLAKYSQSMQWVMDEFAHGYSGHLVDAGLYTVVDPVKTALPYLAYRAALGVGDSAVAILRLWRAEMLVVALGMVGLTALLARRLYQSTTMTLLSAFTLLSFSNFIERSFRVRNDNFATLLALASLAAITAPGRWSSLLGGALAGAAFLCTQKAVYCVAALGLAQLVTSRRSRSYVADGARYAGGFAATIVAYAVAFGGLRAPSVVSAVFLSPLRKSHHVLASTSWRNLDRYVDQTLERNLIAYAIVAAGLVAILATLRRHSAERLATALVAVVVSALVFRHPQPWPYVFVMCLPFLALLAPATVVLAPGRAQPWLAMVMALLLSHSYVRNVAALNQDAATQLTVVAKAEGMLAPGDRYFDGVGMIPNRRIAGRHPWWWWDAPTIGELREQLRRGDLARAGSIVEQAPKVWIISYRFGAFGDFIGSFLSLGTVRIDDYILVSGRALGPGESRPFRNLWHGDYKLLDARGRPAPAPIVVDGRPCPTPCRIGRGDHRVNSQASVATFLVPADVRPTRELPIRSTPPDLFRGVYDF